MFTVDCASALNRRDAPRGTALEPATGLHHRLEARVQAIELLASSISGVARTLRHFSFQHNAPTPASQLRQIGFFSRLASLHLAGTPCLVGTPPPQLVASGCRGKVCEHAPLAAHSACCGRGGEDCGLCKPAYDDADTHVRVGSVEGASARVAALHELQHVVVSCGDAFGEALAHALAPAKRPGCVVVMA
jgi:hypothetical protein